MNVHGPRIAARGPRPKLAGAPIAAAGSRTAAAGSRTAAGVDDNISPIPSYRPAIAGPRITYHAHRSTAHGPRPTRQARAGELERRAGGRSRAASAGPSSAPELTGSDTGRRSGELEHGPSSTGAAPERAKKRARTWRALEVPGRKADRLQLGLPWDPGVDRALELTAGEI